jgi:glycerate kinase
MHILLVPNALKGSLTANQAAQAMASGVSRACDSCTVASFPIADGGDGFADVMCHALDGVRLSYAVHDALGDPIFAQIVHIPTRRMAVVEAAAACGLAQLEPDRLDAMSASSHGVGELIAHALALDIDHLLVGIGGTATSDGGAGMAAALGVCFSDEGGLVIERPAGRDLQRVSRIDLAGLDPRLQRVRVEVVCDVDNPLLGPRGAAAVYGPQKGASPAQVRELDAGLAHYAALLQQITGQPIHDLAGSGAGGGLSAGLVAFAGGSMRAGIDIIIEQLGLAEQVDKSDLVLTCEGRLDRQTLQHGKAPAGIAQLARQRGVPCIALAGMLDIANDELGPLTAAFTICPGPVTMEQAMQNASAYLRNATFNVVRAVHRKHSNPN